MVAPDPDKASQLHAMASNLRQAAAETDQSRYRVRLLDAARDLENEAARLEGHPSESPKDSSRSR